LESEEASKLSEDSFDEEFSEGFSKVTLNNFLRKNQRFQSVNMMIQMEYCAGESLEKYLAKRNKEKGSGFKNAIGGVIDRRKNLEIFA
jgi:hypothetical protein